MKRHDPINIQQPLLTSECSLYQSGSVVVCKTCKGGWDYGDEIECPRIETDNPMPPLWLAWLIVIGIIATIAVIVGGIAWAIANS